jgi:hypothetical protein
MKKSVRARKEQVKRGRNRRDFCSAGVVPLALHSDTARMFKRFLAAAAMLLVASLSVAAAETPLTNEAIVKLTQAGLSPETIIIKIRASQTKFATDTDSLVALAKEGVADSVIRAMVSSTPAKPAAPAPAPKAKRKRIEDVTVATTGGGKCEHATLEISTNGIKTSGCHETDVNVEWKNVTSVCYLTSFRSTLVLTTPSAERRIHTTTPAALKAVQDAVRAFAPGVVESTSCR